MARLEMTRAMKLAEAKDYVAGRLGASVADLADPLVMHEIRGELRLGRVFETETTYPDDPSPREAKRSGRDMVADFSRISLVELDQTGLEGLAVRLEKARH